MATLVLKNTSGSPQSIFDVGITIAASPGSETATDASNIRKLAASQSLNTLINAGTIVVNNGVADLSIAAGLRYLADLWDQTGFDPVPTVARPGNTVLVDAVNGNDGTGARGDASKPFLTVAAALAAALSGDEVIIRPGTYSLAAGITIPSGVTVRGMSLMAVTLQMLGVVAGTTLVTMGTNSSLEDLTLKLTTTGNFALTGVLWPGATSATAAMRGVGIVLSNAGAGAVAAALTGILVQSTGTPDRSQVNIRGCTVSVTADAAATGVLRGILMNTSAGKFTGVETEILITGGTGAGRSGAEINIAGGTLTLMEGSISAPSNDLVQTAGTLEDALVTLIEGTTSGTITYLGIAGTFHRGQATATPDTTSTSTTDVLIAGMTLTPVAGTYLVFLALSFEEDTVGTTVFFSIYSGGVQVAASELRTQIPTAAAPRPSTPIAVVTVNGAQAIEGRVRVSSGTATIHQRTLMILQVA